VPTPARTSPARLAGLLTLGIALVLLVTSVSWFTADRTGVGITQLVVAVLLGVLGVVLVRRRPAG
jgi:hypothetical protein